MSVRTRLLAGLIAVTTAVLFMLVGNRVMLMRHYARQRDERHATFVADLLAYELARKVNGLDQKTINTELMSLFVGEPHIAWIAVIDTSNRVRFTTHQKLLSQPDSLTRRVMSDGQQSVIVTHVNLPARAPYKSVQIGYSTSEISRATRTSLYWGLAISFVLIIVVSAVSWLISGMLLKPLTQMQEAAEAISRGNFKKRIPVRSNDVVGRLGNAFNDMAAELDIAAQTMRDKINAATSALESRNHELLEKQRELQDTNRRLHEADELKTHFISIASHELRSPITSIRGFAQTLIDLPFSDQERIRYLRIIEEESSRLAKMIENFLDLSRIEAGRFSLQMEYIDVATLLEKTAETFIMTTQKRVLVQNQPALPPLRADPERLTRALTNLLDNAEKYGGDTIQIAAEQVHHDLHIIVADNGQGIPLEETKRIFERFYRGKSRRGRQRGTGLGLAIVDEIARAHGGSVRCESEQGKGTRIILSLPFE
jgi:signal transduction histidine kinase